MDYIVGYYIRHRDWGWGNSSIFRNMENISFIYPYSEEADKAFSKLKDKPFYTDDIEEYGWPTEIEYNCCTTIVQNFDRKIAKTYTGKVFHDNEYEGLQALMYRYLKDVKYWFKQPDSSDYVGAILGTLAYARITKLKKISFKAESITKANLQNTLEELKKSFKPKRVDPFTYCGDVKVL